MRYLVGRRHAVHHAPDAQHFFVMMDLRLLAGRSERDFFPVASKPVQELSHSWERFHRSEIVFLKYFAAVFLGLVAEFADLSFIQKFRQILIAPLADLLSKLVGRKLFSEMPERFLPCQNMEVV